MATILDFRKKGLQPPEQKILVTLGRISEVLKIVYNTVQLKALSANSETK
jgi:hypothetical protein